MSRVEHFNGEVPEGWGTHTPESLDEMDKWAEAEHNKLAKEKPQKSSFIPQNPNPPF
jgi:hypothetical protein